MSQQGSGRGTLLCSHPYLSNRLRRPRIRSLAAGTRVRRRPAYYYFVRLRAPAPPGHQGPGGAGNEKPAEAGSEVKATPPGAGFTRLFGRSVARALMPGRGRAEQSDKGELGRRRFRERTQRTARTSRTKRPRTLSL